MNRRQAIVSALTSAVALATAWSPLRAADPAPSTKSRLIIQVSDPDPKKWGLALNNAKNVQTDLGKSSVEIEIVAYGPGIGMLKLDSEVANRVSEAMADGVKVVACENTMTNQKISKDDLLPKTGYVKAGIEEITKKQHQAYEYLPP